MKISIQLAVLMLAGILSTACSGTKKDISWTSESYKGKIENVYIIGIASSELNRMLFENTFDQRLVSEGVKTVPSFTDLPMGQKTDRKAIIKRMNSNHCDSVLLTRVVGQQTNATFMSNRTVYRPGPYYSVGGSVSTPSHYNNWGNYYSYSSTNYVVPATTQFVTLTVESVLYDLETEELIWSAQFETQLEGDIERMMKKFVEEATGDLRKKGLI